MLYVASPFTHPVAAVRYRRYRQAVAFVGWAVSQRLRVYSPIVHFYEAARAAALPTDHEFWLWLNLADLDRAAGVAVLVLPGWTTSPGIARELEEAGTRHLEVRFYAPLEDGRRWRAVTEDEAFRLGSLDAAHPSGGIASIVNGGAP